MKKNFQLIIPVAGPNSNFEKFKNHKLLINIQNKKLIEWVQISKPYKLANGIFIFKKKHEKKYNLVKIISKLLKKKNKIFLVR